MLIGGGVDQIEGENREQCDDGKKHGKLRPEATEGEGALQTTSTLYDPIALGRKFHRQEEEP